MISASDRSEAVQLIDVVPGVWHQCITDGYIRFSPSVHTQFLIPLYS